MIDYNEISYERATGKSLRKLAKKYNTSKSNLIRHTFVDKRVQEITKTQLEGRIRSGVPTGYNFYSKQIGPVIKAECIAHWQTLVDEGIPVSIIAGVYQVSRQIIYRELKRSNE